jgi:hypothetical protein
MIRDAKSAPAIVYLLADNLDTALAAGEDLMKSTIVWQSRDHDGGDDLAAQRALERRAVEAVRATEMVLVARVIKSRESALDLARSEVQFKPIAKMYAAGTTLLADAVEDLADGTKELFESGDCITAYLRSRGLIAEDAAAPHEAEVLPVTEDFRVCGRVALGPLMDLVATLLDALDRQYDLYDELDEGAVRVGLDASRGPVGATVQ